MASRCYVTTESDKGLRLDALALIRRLDHTVGDLIFSVTLGCDSLHGLLFGWLGLGGLLERGLCRR